MTEVRRAVESDAPDVGQLLYEFNLELGIATPSAHVLGERFASILTGGDAAVLIAERAAGFAFLTFRPTPYHDGPLAQLEDLFVRASERGQGIGSALMIAAVREARERGSADVHANVDEVDIAARRFYRNHDFLTVLPGTDYRVLHYQRAV